MDYSELANEFMRSMQVLRKNRVQRKLSESLQGGQYILYFLYMRGEPVIPGEISNEMSISTARTAAALNNLESKGLISREINKNDRRQIFVTLTREGIKLAEEHIEEFRQRTIGLLKGLGEHDAKELVRILHKIERNIEKK